MTLLEEEAQMRELLAPLSRVESVSLPARKRHRYRRPAVIAGFLAAAFLATGAAIADVNPFTGIAAFVGIGAADHAQTSQDVLDPTAAALVQKFNERLTRSGLRQALPDTARLVGQLPDGHKIYVLSTTTDELCIVIDQMGAVVGAPPSPSEPTTIATFDNVVNGSDATPPISWGITKDGITAVSFMGGGSEQMVPVVNNVWAYEGENSALQSITVHSADGTTQTITH
jgi:hypothetical protein